MPEAPKVMPEAAKVKPEQAMVPKPFDQLNQALQYIEDMTSNADQVQERVLGEILSRNAHVPSVSRSSSRLSATTIYSPAYTGSPRATSPRFSPPTPCRNSLLVEGLREERES
ncbi:unnamed protein product [Victoria cruziana]